MARAADGTGDYIDHGDVTAIEGIANLTFACWVNVQTLVDFDEIISKGTGLNGIAIRLAGAGEGTNNDLQFNVFDGTVRYGYTNANIITVGIWYHVLLWFDGSQTGDAKLRGYHNGTSQTLTFLGAGAVPATTAATTNSYKSFAESDATNDIAARIAWLHFFNINLTANQILSLARGVNPFAYKSTNCILLCPYEGNDSTEPDYVSQTNKGTVTNATKYAGNPPVQPLSLYISGFT